MRQGEIWLVSLPIAAGREQGGERPAVILQDATYGKNSPLVILVPLTSRLGALRFPGTVRIEPTGANGLSLPSVAMAFQIRALDRTRFVRRLGTLEPATLTELLSEIDGLLGR